MAARPTRALSQNFLARRATADRFVHALRTADRAAGHRRPGLLLEVGAGEGLLTEALAPYAHRMLAYEIDPRLLPALRARFGRPDGPYGHIRIQGGDFLEARPPREPFALTGNLPYSRTSAIVHWALRAPALTAATFLTQLEYARKRTGDYRRWSLLTVRTWPTHQWRLCGRVHRGEFRPVPRVDSGILRIDHRPVPLLAPRELTAYRRMVEAGFAGVGGSLYASLLRAYGPRGLAGAFARAGLERETVVAFVAPRQWLTLFGALHGTCPGR